MNQCQAELDQYQSDLHRNRLTVLHVGIDKNLHYNTSETILLVDSQVCSLNWIRWDKDHKLIQKQNSSSLAACVLCVWGIFK